jgi:simple sugar transport system substrate-binding protein
MGQGSFDQNDEAGAVASTVTGTVGRRGAVALATALGAGAAGLVGGMGRAFAQSGPYPGLPRRPLKFVFVCHVTLDPFFVPTVYGVQDGCAAFGCRYQWTGSQNNVVSEMVNAMETAIDEKADGIAVCLVDPKAFDAPTARAIAAGIPVVAFNADVPKGSPNQRLSYVGQPLFQSGYDVAAKFMSRVPKGGHVMLSIGVPGSLNEQPRIDGYIQWIKDNGNPVTYDVVNTGVDGATEIARISSYVLSHKNLAGIFCGGGSDTYAAGFVSAEYGLAKKGMIIGGFDLFPQTLQYIKAGHTTFTTDQQAYLQGFLPLQQLYMYKLSNGLVGPADTNTSKAYVTSENVDYYEAKSRFEGSTRAEPA